MWRRVRAAVGGWVVAAASAVQAAGPADPCPECDRLPPLLRVPAQSAPADPIPPTDPLSRPAIEYDRSKLYLPDSLPVAPAAAAGPSAPPPDRGWLAPALLLGWSSNAPAPAGLPGIDRLDLPFRPGIRVDAGWWLDPDQTRAVEAGALYIAQTGGSRLSVVPAGGGLGLVAADWDARFTSADVGLRREIYRGKSPVAGELRLTAGGGYRFAYLSEDLSERVAVGSQLARADVRVSNYFHAAEAGLVGGWWWGYWSVDLAGRVGLGAVVTDVTRSAVGVPTASGQGVRFGAMPTVSATVGRRVGDHTRLFAGYTFQYLTGVGRPGGPPDRATEFRVQGVNLGVEWGY